MALDCTQIRNIDNRILCEGLNEIIANQNETNQLLSNVDFTALASFANTFSVDTIYFILGVISAIAFIQGVRLRL